MILHEGKNRITDLSKPRASGDDPVLKVFGGALAA